MKKTVIMLVVCWSLSSLSFSQTGASFSKAQQTQIAKILGKDFTPIFSSEGELVVTKGTSIRSVKALPGGGFSNVSKLASAEKNELIHKGWILRSSKQALEAMKTQLGEERFKQIEQVLAAPEKGATFSAANQTKIKNILGKDYTPVFNAKGELLVTSKTSVSRVKALPGGGFSNVSGLASAEKNELIHKGWILRSSKQALESMKTKLGKERFKQLEAVLMAN